MIAAAALARSRVSMFRLVGESPLALPLLKTCLLPPLFRLTCSYVSSISFGISDRQLGLVDNTNAVYSSIVGLTKKEVADLYLQTSFSRLLKMLKVFQAKHGDLLIASNFIVPSDSQENEWPRFAHGYKLGQKVGLLRRLFEKKKLPVTMVNQLNEIDFIWKERKYRMQRAILALEIYKKLYGDCYVPKPFVVPKNNLWPRHLWGYRLGIVCVNVRNYPNSYKLLREPFAKLGFDLSAQMWPFELIKQALLVFHKINGHFNVPSKFVVPGNPENDPDYYPPSLEGACLGHVMCKIRKGDAHQSHRAELEAIGVSMQSQQYHRFVDLLTALQAYRKWAAAKQILESVDNKAASFHVPQRFVVPKDGEYFDQKQWGMMLGRRWDHMIRDCHYIEYHDDLIEHGFLTKKESQILHKIKGQHKPRRRSNKKE